MLTDSKNGLPISNNTTEPPEEFGYYISPQTKKGLEPVPKLNKIEL